MAQWAERDPRWVVEDRPDGANVNNWHWQEKNVLPWSRDDLAARLTGHTAAVEGGTVRVTKVAAVEGEAYLTTRKGGKRLEVYDLSLTLEWEVDGGGGGEGGGGSASTSTPTTGTTKITEAASSGDADDVLFDSGEGNRSVSVALRPGVLAALDAYAAALATLEL